MKWRTILMVYEMRDGILAKSERFPHPIGRGKSCEADVRESFPYIVSNVARRREAEGLISATYVRTTIDGDRWELATEVLPKTFLREIANLLPREIDIKQEEIVS